MTDAASRATAAARSGSGDAGGASRGSPAAHRAIRIPPPSHGVAAGPSGAWHFCGPPLPVRQGWKLYISATLLNFVEVLETVAPILEASGTAFKYVASEKALRKLNAGLSGYSQVGKCIVAYLAEGEQAAALVPRLKGALRRFAHRCPEVPFARPFGGGLPLFYRYGAYAGEEVVLGGLARPDVRDDVALAVPPGVADVLGPFAEPVPRDEAFAAFLTRYPLFEAISQGGKGAVFGGFDLSRPRFTEVIVKIGYRNGQVMPDGRDGFDLLRRESDFFEALERAALDDVAPARLEYREFRRLNALVMERLPGDNLMSGRQRGTLAPEQVADCLAILRRVHRHRLYVGDPKLANFVTDAAGRARAVDFECAGRVAGAAFDPLRTFRLYNPEIADLRKLDLAHFLFSVLYDGDAASFSERDRLVDLAEVLRRPAPTDPAAAFALERLRALVG